MSNTFTKAVLKTGVYHSPDGEIPVTPERLRHWESQVRRLQSNGYMIPMHWDHASKSNVNDLAPVRMSGMDHHSAEKSVGKLVDFRVAADGNSAELTVQTLTDSATEAARKNTVFVSPVLWDEFKGSNGYVYKDMIGSVDFVDYPVDTSQGPFEPALALMSAKRKPCVLRMSGIPSKIYRLSGDSKVDDDDKKNDEETTTTNESEGTTTTEESSSVEPEAETATSPKLTKCIASLATLGIVLSDDTTVENFLERLEVGLDTFNAANGNQAPAAEEEGANTVVDPQIATMSAKVKNLEDRILGGEKTKLQDRLQALLDSGRCVPAEFDAQKKKLGITRMSLLSDNTVQPTDSSKWIESRECLQEGACWDANEKLQRMSSKESKAPESWSHKPSENQADGEAMKQQKAEMLRR